MSKFSKREVIFFTSEGLVTVARLFINAILELIKNLKKEFKK